MTLDRLPEGYVAVPPPSVLLLGYYGRGNFGDDLLMVVTHRLVQEALPRADLSIRVSRRVDYVARLLGPAVRQIPFGTRDSYSVLVHGGGGNFFDFVPHQGLRARLRRLPLAFGGSFYSRLDRLARRMAGKNRVSGAWRIGLGIGVGTYTPGSRRLLEELPVLADFDILWVRDPGSRENVGRLGIRPTLIVGSDLAFLTENWCPEALYLSDRQEVGPRPSVGLILRDWDLGSPGLLARRLSEFVKRLEDHYAVELISLDPATDAATLAELSHLPCFAWNPDVHGLGSVAEVLARQHVIVSARAHGAICAACVGRPSMVLEIEPKLRAVAEMLPSATVLADPLAAPEILMGKLDEAFRVGSAAIRRDVLRNRDRSRAALAEVMGLIVPHRKNPVSDCRRSAGASYDLLPR